MGHAMSLRVQLLLLQALIVCAVTVATGAVASALQEHAIRNAYQDRMIAVAQSVARLPAILAAFDDPDPSLVIQPIAEVIRESSDVTYVVVTDAAGIRYSHPEPARIGERVSTDPSVPLSGQTYVGTQTGTLGTTWRVKVPIFAADGEVIGTTSVGILESALTEEFLGSLGWLLLTMAASAVVGVFGAAGVTAIIRKRIYRLEPREIAALVEGRETMLHRLSEGMVTVDERGVISLVNDAAERLLARPADELLGRRAEEVLEPALREVLEDGEPEGRLVLAGERVLIARSTGAAVEGRAVEATLLIRDHTELHTMLRQMDGAQSLADGLRAQAHEFANTMHVISGLLEIEAVDEARQFVARSVSGGSLALSTDAPVLGDLELTALLSVKAAQARELGIQFEVRDESSDSADDGDWFDGDLLTVVGNLVDNALEACSVGDRVLLIATRDARRMSITIDDEGPGVPRELRERIFTEGVSTKAPDGQDSRHRRGIGLALVRRVVDRRNGRITVRSAPGGGARFVVQLPRPARQRRDPVIA